MGNYGSRDVEAEGEKFGMAEEENDWEGEKENDFDGIVDGEGEGFDLLQSRISKLQRIFSNFYNYICKNKEYLVKDPEMKELVRDYRDNSLRTSKFYRELSESLRMERKRQKLIEMELENPPSEASQRVKELLREYVNEIPFKDIDSQVEELVGRHEMTRKKLETKREKIKAQLGESDSRRATTADKVWWTVLRIFSCAMTVADIVFKGLAEFLGPIPWAGTAMDCCSATIRTLNEKIVNRLNLLESLETVNIIDHNTSVSVAKLNESKSLVEDAISFNKTSTSYAKEYLGNNRFNFAEMAKEIKKSQKAVIEKIDYLCKFVDDFKAELHKQREELSWA